jgi:hypothetical protein
MRDGEISASDWAKSLGTGLLTGVAFVAVAMMLENKVIKAGAKLIR